MQLGVGIDDQLLADSLFDIQTRSLSALVTADIKRLTLVVLVANVLPAEVAVILLHRPNVARTLVHRSSHKVEALVGVELAWSLKWRVAGAGGDQQETKPGGSKDDVSGVNPHSTARRLNWLATLFMAS